MDDLEKEVMHLTCLSISAFRCLLLGRQDQHGAACPDAILHTRWKALSNGGRVVFFTTVWALVYCGPPVALPSGSVVRWHLCMSPVSQTSIKHAPLPPPHHPRCKLPACGFCMSVTFRESGGGAGQNNPRQPNFRLSTFPFCFTKTKQDL